jgi:hypothetical protein
MKPNLELDVISEDENEDNQAPSEDDADCGSGAYKGPSSKATSSNDRRNTRSSGAADLKVRPILVVIYHLNETSTS